jgi:hypothetical protein
MKEFSHKLHFKLSYVIESLKMYKNISWCIKLADE